MNLWLVIAVAAGFFVFAGVVTVVWWKLAERMFPGANRATGQDIRLIHKRQRAPEGPGPTVVRDFGGQSGRTAEQQNSGSRP